MTTKPPAALFISLKLREGKYSTVKQDTATVSLLPSVLQPFGTLFIKVPSFADAPDAMDHPLVQDAITYGHAICSRVVFVRGLWPSWATGAYDATAHLNPGFYIDTIERLKKEVEAYATWQLETGLDVEVDGQPPQRGILARTLSYVLTARIRHTVGVAIGQAGQVDWVTPIASSSPDYWVWPFFLGRHGFDQKSYRMTAARKFPGTNVRLPDWGVYNPDVYALWATPDGVDKDDRVTAKVDDFLAFTSDDLARLQVARPSYRQLGLYAAPDQAPVVLTQLARKLLERSP